MWTRLPPGSNWRRHLFCRKETVRTTWKLRFALLIIVLLAFSATRGFWALAIAQSLVCKEDNLASDVVFVENLDKDYLLFERAARLQAAGTASRIVVAVPFSGDGGANPLSKGIAELMSRTARLQDPEFLLVQEIEPITLNTAYQLRDFLGRKQFKSGPVV